MHEVSSLRPVAVPLLSGPRSGTPLFLLSGTFAMLQQKSTAFSTMSLLIDHSFVLPRSPWDLPSSVSRHGLGRTVFVDNKSKEERKRK
jgi:hypothetical protein